MKEQMRWDARWGISLRVGVNRLCRHFLVEFCVDFFEKALPA